MSVVGGMVIESAWWQLAQALTCQHRQDPHDSQGVRVLEHFKTDESLVAACQKGDQAAADAMVEQYWDRVFAYAYKLCLNQADAEDLAQESFLRALKRISTFRPDGSLKSWLFRIATNIFLDHRKAARNKDVLTSEFISEVRDEYGPRAQVSNSEKLDMVWREIGQLSKEQRSALVLRSMEKMEYHQIAEVLAVKESTARWHLYEARRILRERLDGYLDLEEPGDGD